MKIVYEFFNCEECPYCKQGRSYGTDGRDGITVFICRQGAFGGADGGYAYGKVITEIREGIDKNCPLDNLIIIK